MKNNMYKWFVILMIAPMITWATNPKGKIDKSKTIKKEFSVSANALVKIDNKFGNLDVVTWNENRVVIEITITVNGNNESKVADQLENIDVQFSNSQNEVYAKTVIQKSNSGWWGSNNNMSFEINYKVKMPVTNMADFTNDYGSISLNELKGKADINCDYGKIIIGSLHHDNNSINIDYTNNSTIEFMNGGSINADYSGFTVDKAKKIDLNADYTSSSFENIENLTFNCDYGSLSVENGNRINGNGDYLTMKFGTIYKVIKINADYGGIRIDQLKAGFETVDINADYTGVKMNVDAASTFKIIVKTSYGGFSYDDDFIQFDKKIDKNNSKYYEGFAGNNNASSSIQIETGYGSIKIYKN
ncbi:hypothetical protein [Namhaeicola litoreus]|uniref:Adhesin n=1 Tax=Namhaeicola litoreus TaxID=1052145 RepID=A0ABW3Y478_9FLAO